MPELPEMQALAERLSVALSGRRLEGIDQLGFTGLKTAVPPADGLIGHELTSFGRRGKYLVAQFDDGQEVLVHLSQAGRVDVEEPPKATKPRGSVVRFRFSGALGLLVREYGTQRKAGWWVLAPGDEGPRAGLGPDPFDQAFEDLILGDTSNRHLHTQLRDQRYVAGIGRGWVDDALHRAHLSPFASLRSLDATARRTLIDAIRSVLTEALALERTRSGGLSEAKLGSRFAVHNRFGEPCPQCGQPLRRVSYESYEITYCPHDQTNGKVLADRRLSRLLR